MTQPTNEAVSNGVECARPRQRFVVLAAAVLMQTCLGATYSWSIFVQAFRDQSGFGQALAQTPFTVFYIVFPATTILAGTLMNRLGPRRCAVIGGLVFGGGWFLAGLGHVHFALTWLGVGVLGGFGVGMAYLVPIAIGMLWFPRNKALVTGVAVAGFGGGSALVAQIADRLMRVGGLTPFQALPLLGIAFATLIAFAGLQMRRPPGFEASATSGAPGNGFLRDRVFLRLYFVMFAGLAAGLAVNSNVRQLVATVDAAAGAAAVSLFAIANAPGRVCWGAVFDRRGSTGVLRVNLLIQAVLLLASALVLRSAAGLAVFAFVAGFNYGGVLVLYASAVAQRWGSRQVGRVYGWLFSSNIPAAGASFLTAFAFDRLGGFGIPFAVLAGLLLVAAASVPRPVRS